MSNYNLGEASNDKIAVSPYATSLSDDKTLIADFQRLLESTLMNT